LAHRMPLHLLLADDNIVNQKVALRLFEQMGYRIDIACDGVEAIEAIERQHYDIVFMDVQMPEMNGLEATQRIREREQTHAAETASKGRTVIIAMTASAMIGDREKCLKAGMDDYLSKPVRPEAVQKALELWGPVVRDAPGRPAASTGKPDTSFKSAASRAPAPGLPHAPAVIAMSANDEPPVDMERLSELAGDDESGIRDLATLYLTQTTAQMDELKAAIQSGAVKEVERIAHKSAGASATCGMNAIVPFLRELERQGREAALSGADALFAQAAKELERIRAFLKNR